MNMMNEQDPNDIRAQLFASLQQRLAPVAQPDVAAQEAAAKQAQDQSNMIRSGVQLGQAFLGNANSNGDNLYSQSLEGDAKTELAKALEAKRLATEAEKRREELRNGLTTRFVDDQNLTARQAKEVEEKRKDYATATGDKRADAETQFERDKELERIRNQGKLSAIEAKGEQKLDKPLEAKIVNDKTALDNTLSLLGTIKELKKGIPTGQGQNIRNSAAQLINIDDPQVSGFKAMVGTQLADYIKSISGAAVSDQERAFLIKNVPTMQDSDETFNQKLDQVIERLTANRQRFLDNIEGSGRKVSDQFKQTGAPSSDKLSADEQAELDALEKQFGK